LVFLEVREIEGARVQVLDSAVVSFATVICGPGGVTFPNIAENLELSSADWLDGLENRPSDTLSAWWCGEGTVVAPEFIKVESLEETLKAERTSNGVLSCKTAHLTEEHVSSITTFFNIKHDAKDGAKFSIRCQVDKMHLEIHMLSHDSVL